MTLEGINSYAANQSYYKRQVHTKSDVKNVTAQTDTISNTSNQDPLTYYNSLCKEFSGITFRLEDKAEGEKNTNQVYLGYNNSMNQVGSGFGNQGQCSISLDISVIKRMQSDPAYEERVKGMIENTKDQYSQYEAQALQDGYSYVSVSIEDNGGNPVRGVMNSNIPYSTEEQVKAMWSNENSQNLLQNKVKNAIDSLSDTYLQMLEESSKRKSIMKTEDTKDSKEAVVQKNDSENVINNDTVSENLILELLRDRKSQD